METDFPVVNFITVRMLFALVSVLVLELYQMDVETAFMNGHLKENIYMKVPDGLGDPKHPDLVCKLLRSLCGLNQAPHQWYAKLHALLDVIGIKRSKNDCCLYILHASSEFILTVLYVDDLPIAGYKGKVINRINGEFKKRFEIIDMR